MSEVKMEQDCLYCMVAGQRERREVVYDSGRVLAFLEPGLPGQASVMLKAHGADPWDMPAMEEIGRAAQRVMLAQRALWGSEGAWVVQERGPQAAGAAHGLVRVLPRYPGEAPALSLTIPERQADLAAEAVRMRREMGMVELVQAPLAASRLAPEEAKRLAILRVLASMAWSDGVMEKREMGLIRSIAKGMGLSEAGQGELESLFSRPLSLEESDTLLEDLISQTLTRRERRAVLSSLSEVAQADSQTHPREEMLLRRVRQALGYRNLITRILASIRGGHKSSPA